MIVYNYKYSQISHIRLILIQRTAMGVTGQITYPGRRGGLLKLFLLLTKTSILWIKLIEYVDYYSIKSLKLFIIYLHHHHHHHQIMSSFSYISSRE